MPTEGHKKKISRALPETGKVHEYNFTTQRGYHAPDSLKRILILVNDQLPGPTMEANLGDYFEVTVTNRIASPAKGIYPTHTFHEDRYFNPL
jgi:FtsP/CotA-like multicopper oxidase with cupredoxin domain